MKQKVKSSQLNLCKSSVSGIPRKYNSNEEIEGQKLCSKRKRITTAADDRLIIQQVNKNRFSTITNVHKSLESGKQIGRTKNVYENDTGFCRPSDVTMF